MVEYTPDVWQVEDSYPFGWNMPGRSYSAGENYRFGYQGSEKNEELEGSYTTLHRQLDTRIGRWTAVDPVTREALSPYNSMDNNPITLNDPNGDCPFCPLILPILKVGIAGATVGGLISAGTQYKQTGKVRFDKTALAAGTGFLVANTPGGWMAGGSYAFAIGSSSNIIDQTFLDNKSLSKVNYRQAFATGAFTTASFGLGNLAAPIAKSNISKMFYRHRSNVRLYNTYKGIPSNMLQTRSVSPMKWEFMKNPNIYSTVVGNAVGDAIIGGGTLDFVIGNEPAFLNDFFVNLETALPDFSVGEDVGAFEMPESMSGEETFQMISESASKKIKPTKEESNEYREAARTGVESSKRNKRRY